MIVLIAATAKGLMTASKRQDELVAWRTALLLEAIQVNVDLS